MSERLLLCRPQAGLTDVFSRIGRCVRYADSFGRQVIVEMDFVGAQHFRDDFEYYFVSHDGDLFLSSVKYSKRFDQLKANPKCFSGRINSYVATYSLKVEAIADVETGDIPCFDFSTDHVEPLLLYHASGGGLRKAKIALRRISLSAEVKQVVQARLSRLSRNYTSIHIRNTDFATDYKAHLSRVKSEIDGPIYVATDNCEVLNYCREIFGESRIYNFSNLPNEAGRPIHSNATLDARQHNIDAIADLILLASAQRYYYFPVFNANTEGVSYSGFSKFAELLHNDKQLLRQFVDANFFGVVARVRFKARKILYRLLGRAAFLMPIISRSY
jgi:hypothetical protein